MLPRACPQGHSQYHTFCCHSCFCCLVPCSFMPGCVCLPCQDYDGGALLLVVTKALHAKWSKIIDQKGLALMNTENIAWWLHRPLPHSATHYHLTALKHIPAICNCRLNKGSPNDGRSVSEGQFGRFLAEALKGDYSEKTDILCLLSGNKQVNVSLFDLYVVSI